MGNESHPIPEHNFPRTTRKSRLSFELHPDLLLQDVFRNNVEDSMSVSDDEGESEDAEDATDSSK